jgi:hypothetical protein
MLPGMAGLLLPIGVWKGEERFGAGFLWTLPVDRRRHALAKVCAGWVWLMVTVALFVLWMLAISLLSGGNILAEETLHLLPSLEVPTTGTLDPRALEPVRWTPRPLLWLAPFTAATAMYLVGGFTEAANMEWLATVSQPLLEPIYLGPYGFDALLTARTETLRTEATLSTGERVGVWRGLPDLGQWAMATLLWTSAGLVALWAAASRHRESRRA